MAGGDNRKNRAAYTREGRKQLFAVLQSARGSSGDFLVRFLCLTIIYFCLPCSGCPMYLWFWWLDLICFGCISWLFICHCISIPRFVGFSCEDFPGHWISFWFWHISVMIVNSWSTVFLSGGRLFKLWKQLKFLICHKCLYVNFQLGWTGHFARFSLAKEYNNRANVL